jgi:exopolysaccharide production protein ExoZ
MSKASVLQVNRPQKGTPRSLNTLQAGRAVACLAVLLFHTNFTLSLPKYLGREIFPVFGVGGAGVQFFFVLSGFVILLAHRKDIDRPSKVREFLWKRFRRVYPVLWIVLLLVIPAFLLVPSYGTGKELGFGSIVPAFLLSPSQQDYLLKPMWTLRHEVLFYLIFSVSIWRRRTGFAIGAIWLLLSAIVPWLHLDFPWSFLFSSNHLLFAFGILACLAFQSAQVPRSAALTAAVIGAIAFSSVWFIDLYKVLTIRDALNVLYGLGAALMVLGLAVLERDRGLWVPETLTFLGEASYSIYLVHFPALSAAIKVTLMLNRLLRAPAPIVFVTAASAALGAGVLFHLAIERPLMVQLTRRSKLLEPTAVTV